MFTIFFSFIKSKLLSSTGIFLLCFAAIFTIFLIYNSDTVLSKFGFETKSNLKSDLTLSKEQTRQLIGVNDSLNKAIVDQELSNKKIQKSLVENFQEQKEVTVKIDKIMENKRVISKPIEKTLIEKSETTDKEYKLSKVEYDQLSSINIDSLHLTFQSLEFSSNNLSSYEPPNLDKESVNV